MCHKKSLPDLDLALYEESMKDHPDMDKIKTLLDKGADINAAVSFDDTLLCMVILHHNPHDSKDDIEFSKKGLELVKFLLENGADPNIITCDGYNCLYDAWITENAEIFEILLKGGASPNFYGVDTKWSFLDEVDFDISYEEWQYGEESCKTHYAMREMLVKYGAKPTEDIKTTNLSYFLHVHPFLSTGLVTFDGLTDIACLPCVSDKLKNDFQEWIASVPSQYLNGPDYQKESEEQFQMLSDFNLRGRMLAKQLKEIVGESINLVFYSFYRDYNIAKYALLTDHEIIK